MTPYHVLYTFGIVMAVCLLLYFGEAAVILYRRFREVNRTITRMTKENNHVETE